MATHKIDVLNSAYENLKCKNCPLEIIRLPSFEDLTKYLI